MASMYAAKATTLTKIFGNRARKHDAGLARWYTPGLSDIASIRKESAQLSRAHHVELALANNVINNIIKFKLNFSNYIKNY